MVHDYQLTTIGNALKYFGYSFNSIDPNELAEAEKLLIEAKPHLFAINSDYQPAMRAGDAVMSVAWTGDAKQLNRDIPEIRYVLGKEGGEIWTDFYAIPKGAQNRPAAYAFINFLLDPAVNAREVKAHGYPSTDKRTSALLPQGGSGGSDPLPGAGASLGARVRRGGHADRPEPGRADGALQVRLTGTWRRDARTATTALLVGPAAAFFLLLLVLPLAVVVIYSFGERGAAGGYSPAFTFDNYLSLATRGQAFVNTLMLAPLGTLLCALVAFPLAYFLAMKASPRWRTMLLVLIIVPLWASQLLRIYAWLLILGDRGIPSLLELVGMDGVRLINTRFAVLLGMVYGYLPLMVSRSMSAWRSSTSACSRPPPTSAPAPGALSGR